MEFDYPFELPHEVLHHLITKRGVDVNHASCVEARVDQMLGDMIRQFCKEFKRDSGTCICIGFHGGGVRYTKYLKSASAEVFNWNLTNEVDSEKAFVRLYAQGHCLCLWLSWQTHY